MRRVVKGYACCVAGMYVAIAAVLAWREMARELEPEQHKYDPAHNERRR